MSLWLNFRLLSIFYAFIDVISTNSFKSNGVHTLNYFKKSLCHAFSNFFLITNDVCASPFTMFKRSRDGYLQSLPRYTMYLLIVCWSCVIYTLSEKTTPYCFKVLKKNSHNAHSNKHYAL